jgi:SH3 domain protein
MLNMLKITIISLLISAPALAETRYITDISNLVVRSGPSSGHRFVGRIASGAAVEVIQYDEEKQWAQIKTPRGNDVWIETKHLMDQPAAREQIESMQTNFRKLENQYREEIASLKAELMETNAIKDHNQELVLNNTRLEQQLELIGQQNDRLSERSSTDFMKIGAIILLVGMFVGWILPKFSGSGRKNGWA